MLPLSEMHVCIKAFFLSLVYFPTVSSCLIQTIKLCPVCVEELCADIFFICIQGQTFDRDYSPIHYPVMLPCVQCQKITRNWIRVGTGFSSVRRGVSFTLCRSQWHRVNSTQLWDMKCDCKIGRISLLIFFF